MLRAYRKKACYPPFLLYLLRLYENAAAIFVETGNTEDHDNEFFQIVFYKKYGFAYAHTIKNFFIDNHPQPIISMRMESKASV